MNRYTALFIGTASLWFLAFILTGHLLAGTSGIIAAELAYLAVLAGIGYRVSRA